MGSIYKNGIVYAGCPSSPNITLIATSSGTTFYDHLDSLSTVFESLTDDEKTMSIIRRANLTLRNFGAGHYTGVWYNTSTTAPILMNIHVGLRIANQILFQTDGTMKFRDLTNENNTSVFQLFKVT